MKTRKIKSEEEQLSNPLTDYVLSIKPAVNAIVRLTEWMVETVFSEDSEYGENLGPAQRKVLAMSAIRQTIAILEARARQFSLNEMEEQIRAQLIVRASE